MSTILLASGSQGFASSFDSVNDYLYRTDSVYGSNSSQFIFEAVIDMSSNATMPVLAGVAGSAGSPTSQAYFRIEQSGGQYFFRAGVNSGSDTLDITSSLGSMSSLNGYQHILCSMDFNAAAGARASHLYIDDVSDKVIGTDTGSAFSLPHASMTTMWIAGQVPTITPPAASSGGLWANVGRIYFAPGQFLDFSTTSNRRKFIDASGVPVQDIGYDGSTPTGTAPAILFQGRPGRFKSNTGTGGAFSLAGELDPATVNPWI